jgi:hypothetical protein
VKFELWIETGNEAMQTAEDVAAALKHLAKRLPKRWRKLAYGKANGPDGKGPVDLVHDRVVMDENGNKIGAYKLIIKDGP